jgi:hypothetical protein
MTIPSFSAIETMVLGIGYKAVKPTGGAVRARSSLPKPSPNINAASVLRPPDSMLKMTIRRSSQYRHATAQLGCVRRRE